MNDTPKDESFRDHLATVDQEGKRIWIYPKKPSGKYYTWRTYVSIFLLAVLFVGPFIRIGGEPLLLLNIMERRFVIFGAPFWPQDIHLFVLAFIIGIVFIIVFTVAFGRLFCGWVCPQTIFMEMVFRKIEYAIEGDRGSQQALDRAPWNADKIRKRALKHLTFFLISFLIANTFLAYIIGSDDLIDIITDPPTQHLAGLGAITVFTFVFYAVFARFREQVCTTVCPYGRLQGVLLDRDSVVIAYDRMRGEQRGKFRKNEERSTVGKGDCIDCHQCVLVCPTGIDIRNGTQLECVNCTACIDACDHMMESVKLPKGLIRYASESEIADKRAFRYTPRMKAYSAVLGLLLVAFFSVLFMRSEVETSILRTPGVLYQDKGEEGISNLYNYKLINKTDRDMPIRFALIDHAGEVQLVGEAVEIPPAGRVEGAMFILLDRSQLDGRKTKLKIGVYSGDELVETVKTNFIGPFQR